MKYDIIIVGGGIVGLTCACLLAQKTSLSIAILESQAPFHPWSSSRYHHRVSAIAISSQRIFQSLAIWNNIKEKRISPFTKIEVWDAEGRGAIQFDSQSIAESVLGFIIENNAIQSALLEKIAQYPQIDMISPIQLTDFSVTESQVEMVAADGQVYTAKLAVAADGANSWLREKAGIEMNAYDYEQEAIVATVQTTLPHQKIARQVFLASGPLAFLPLAEANTSSIVWSLPTDEAKRLLALSEDEFTEKLAFSFAHKLGDITQLEKRYSFPLRKQQAKQYIKPRIALIGDSAHTIHPLAGQGVNIGLLDAASLAEVIVDANKNRRDFAGFSQLRRYERWRKAENLAMLAGIDMIKKLFASEKKSIQTLRTLGLNFTNRMQWIKNIFTRHAVGN